MGTFAIEGLKAGPWYFTFEEPGQSLRRSSGPIALKKGDNAQGRSRSLCRHPWGLRSKGKVENVPYGMAGSIWLIAFDGGVVRREVRIGPGWHLPTGGACPPAATASRPGMMPTTTRIP